MPIPVILDTDAGYDIDDAWAIALMLNCPELDVKLITAGARNSEGVARAVAKLLDAAGRTDIPLGVGPATDAKPIFQQAYIDDYPLARYPGTVHRDGAQALVDCIMASEERVTLVAIGPLTNVAAALAIEPTIAQKARFVGMHGAIYEGYGKPTPPAEYNVVQDVAAAKAVFSADWPVTITPLDTCDKFRLTGEQFAQARDSNTPAMRSVLEAYRVWLDTQGGGRFDGSKESSVLFDCVAIYLAFAEDWLAIEELPVSVDDEGKTVIDKANGRLLRAATHWRDLPAFEQFVADRLSAG